MKINSQAGKNFVLIMVAIAIFALGLRFIAKQVLKFNLAQNEATAQSNLRLVSTALENYAKNNLGSFPADFSSLMNARPAYLDKNYLAGPPMRGYNYSCSRLEGSGYSCTAVPVKCRLTGRTTYIITTGGLLVSEECSK